MKMNERLTTRGLAELLAHQIGMDNKRAEKFIDVLSSYISQGIERNKVVKVLGLGTFKIVLVRERESVHIQTGERFVIPAHHKLSFVPDKDFKERINRSFTSFDPTEIIEDDMPKAVDNAPIAENRVPKKVSFKKDVVADETLTEQEKYVEPVVIVEKDSEITDEVSETTIETDIQDLSEVADEYEPVTPELNENNSVVNEDIIPEQEYDFSEIEEQQLEITEEEEAEEPESDSVIDDDTEYEEDAVYMDAEAREEELLKDEYNPIVAEKKRKTAPLWLWFLLMPLLFVAGVGIGTYAFLHYTSDRTLKTEQLLASNINQETIGNSPLPIGMIPVTHVNIEGTEDEISSELVNEQLAEIETVENPIPEEVGKIVEDSSTTKTTDKKEDKTVIDWLAPSPENPNPKPETRRAEKPNKEIEERNKNLANKTKASTKSTSTSSSGNTRPTNTTAANNTKTIPDRKSVV